MPPTAEQKRKTAELIDAIDIEDLQDEALALIADPTVDINNGLDENDRELLFPLAAAAQYGDTPIIDALLARPDIDMNKATSDGMTALMVAAQQNFEELVEKFLNSGKPIDINLKDKDGKTALDYAYESARALPRADIGRWRVVRFLEGKGAKKGIDIGVVPPGAAAGQGVPPVAAGPTPQKSDEVNDALLKTRQGTFPVNKMVEMIQALPPGQINVPGTKNQGMPHNAMYMTPLQYLFNRVGAIDKKVFEAFFAREDFNPNAMMDMFATPFTSAIRSENFEAMQLLLNHPRLDVNTVIQGLVYPYRKRTALDEAEAMAAENGRYRDFVKKMKEKGAKRYADLPAAAPPAVAAAPPGAAAGQGAPVLTEKQKFEVALATPPERPPTPDDIMKLLEDEKIKEAIVLLKYLPPGKITAFGLTNTTTTPLHYLAQQFYQRDKMMREVLVNALKQILNERQDIEINLLDIGHHTPLLAALYYGNIDIAEALLASKYANKIDYTITDSRGKTALDMARGLLQREQERDIDREMIQRLEILENAIETNMFTKMVNEPGATWKGYSESDVLLLNSMFDVEESGKTLTPQQREEAIQTNIQNFSMCPVCLRYVIRSDACVFMTHECSPPYHRKLYEKYRYTSTNGKTYIEWCTICGRICKGHKHYEIGSATGPVPKFTTNQAITDVAAFGTDCKKIGGGGIEEKFMRIQRMIDTLCDLQTQVGTLSEQEARNILTEKVWDSALEEPDPVLLVEVMEGKKFRLEEECKAILTKPVAEKETTYADVERPADEKALTPVKYDGVTDIQYSPATRALREKANAIPASSSQKEAAEAEAKAAEDAEKENYCAPELGVHEDNRPTYGFRHKQSNGTVLDHGMVKEDGVYSERYCGEHLEELLRSLNLQDTKGKCPLSANCNAKLYPEELKGIVSDEYYETYKRIFNEVNAAKKGGAMIPPIFEELTDEEGICPLPPKGGKKKRTRRTKKKRGLTIGRNRIRH